MTDSTLLRAALAYAEMGWAVIPLHTPNGKGCSCGKHNCGNSIGKHPRIKDWKNQASSDPATIRRWWRQWPGANIGIACGPSKLISIDLDIDDGIDGLETWRDLRAQHQIDDDGALVNLTGSGGQQLIFASNGLDLGNTARKLGPGIDTRGSRGLFVAPPSIHRTGKPYAWEVGAHPADIKPAPIPEQLARLMQASKTAKPETSADSIPEGARNSTLTTFAGAMRRQGMTESEILAGLLAVNDARCRPPLERSEVEGIAKSVARYEPPQITLAQPPPTMQAQPARATESAPADIEPPSAWTLEDCPPLPEAAQIDPALAADAGQWVDLYIAHASAISPMTPATFHESAALWLGAVAIARRLKLAMPFGDVYPNLFVLWMAYTTLYRKSTALDVTRNLARRVFAHLMAAQDTTPEAFLSDLAGREPPSFDALTDQDREDWTRGRSYAAQKGWLLDEASGLLAGAGRDYNAGLIEALLRFYDCDPQYRRSTRGQGLIVVHNSYLSLLGASTPAAMAPHLASERLWSMGWWPRFAVLTPQTDRPAWRVAQWGDEGQDPARDLIEGLAQLYESLPSATWPDPPETRAARLGAGVYETWERYNRACSYDLLTEDLDGRLFGTYGRLPTHALKVGLILAALDGWPKHWTGPTIELRHLARAISTCEEWRASAHRALGTVTRNEFDQMRVRILRQIGRAGKDGATLREIGKGMRDKTPAEIEDALHQMIKTGEVEGRETKGRGRPTVRYTMVAE